MPPRPSGWGRSLLTLLAGFVVVLTGIGAVAMARTGGDPTVLEPYGADAPFGVGYVDGFGEHTPKPNATPPIGSSPSRPSSATVASSPSQRVQSSPPTQPGNAPTSSAPEAPAPPPVAPAQDPATAVYWTKTWRNTYDTYVWVFNKEENPITWEVRIKLPKDVTVRNAMAVKMSHVDDVWIFTPTRSLLGAGRVYLFAFSGTKSRSHRLALVSCLVNGVDCTRFRSRRW